MADLDEAQEVECCYVLIYDSNNFQGMQSGVAEVDALEDDMIYVLMEDDEVLPFPRDMVKPCFEC